MSDSEKRDPRQSDSGQSDSGQSDPEKPVDPDRPVTAGPSGPSAGSGPASSAAAPFAPPAAGPASAVPPAGAGTAGAVGTVTTTATAQLPTAAFAAAVQPIPPLLGVAWKAPAGPPPWALLGTAVAAGTLVGASVPGRPGIGFTLALLVAAAGLLLAVRSAGAGAGAGLGLGRGRLALVGIGAGLGLVPTLRASEWLVLLCLLGAVGLGALAASDGRSWFAVVGAMPVLGIAVARSAPWLRRRLGHLPGAALRPWLVGLTVAVPVTLLVGALLASADEAFAELFRRLVPAVDLGTVPPRVIAGVVVAAMVLGAGFAAASGIGWDGAGPVRVLRLPRRPVVEWLLPLVAVDAVLLAFLSVQATLLFGGAEVVLREAGVTYAERARTGFGQLVAVTVITLLLLTWAALWERRGADGERSRLLVGAGGLMVLLSLAMVVSALRRLWLYEQAYGWTVTRITSGAFEIWLAFVLLGVSALWWLGRTGWSARLVTGSLGVLLLVLGVTGPDGLAASWNVDRYAATGKIDAVYLQLLSDDAVPALSRLPEPLRSCVLSARFASDGADDSWLSWNLARHRAADVTPRPLGNAGRTTCSTP